MQIYWFWLVGLVPYSIRRQQAKDLYVFTVKALFWRLTIRWKKSQCSWNLSVPFIEHLRQ